jgi:hypothetical protein
MADKRWKDMLIRFASGGSVRDMGNVRGLLDAIATLCANPSLPRIPDQVISERLRNCE